MKISSKILLILIITFIYTACKKNNSPVPPPAFVNYTANIQGVQETPPNSSVANGSFSGVYSRDNKTLIFSLTYSAPPPITFNPTSWHIHRGDSGIAGPIVFDLGPIVPSPLHDTLILSADQYNELSSGKYYINIHSSAFTDGEIRGQIMKE